MKRFRCNRLARSGAEDEGIGKSGSGGVDETAAQASPERELDECMVSGFSGDGTARWTTAPVEEGVVSRCVG